METRILKQWGKVKKIWIAACEWEQIDPEGLLIEWSEQNPFIKEYRIQMEILMQLKGGVLK